jgi:hypothetical protein
MIFTNLTRECRLLVPAAGESHVAAAAAGTPGQAVAATGLPAATPALALSGLAAPNRLLW